jgi:regulation of enolase protein 1 (concanavalin A-like superfamily)
MIKVDLKEFPKDFYWYNEPNKYKFDGKLVFYTSPHTDFWQRTHYGFKKDDGHCFLTTIDKDFELLAHLEFYYKELYDQSGIMIRINENYWTKVSIEFKNKKISKLGSVATNLGYSDWAMTEISSDTISMWYKVEKKGKDLVIENSLYGNKWTQMRVSHIHTNFKKIEVGIYACSPKNSSFQCIVKNISINPVTT